MVDDPAIVEQDDVLLLPFAVDTVRAFLIQETLRQRMHTRRAWRGSLPV